MNVTKIDGHPVYYSVDKAVSSSIPSSLENLPMGCILIGPATNKVKHEWGYTIGFDDVDWKIMVKPMKFQVGLQDIDLEAGRVATGIMVRHKKGIKRAISAETPPLTPTEISGILKAIDPSDTPTSTSSEETTAGGMTTCFAVAYHDPWVGGPTCKVMYSGDRIAPMYNGALNLWNGLPLEFVEM